MQVPTAKPGSRRFAAAGLGGGIVFATLLLSGLAQQASAVTFKLFPLPPGHNIVSIAAGSDGAVWFTEGGDLFNQGLPRVGRIAMNGSVKEFPLRGPNGPTEITRGAHGAMWFKEADNSAALLTGAHDFIGRISSHGAVRNYHFGKTSVAIGGLTIGPGGALWLSVARKVGAALPAAGIEKLTTSGKTHFFALNNGIQRLFDITSGSDGALWTLGTSGGGNALNFTSININAVYRMTAGGRFGGGAGELQLHPAKDEDYRGIASGANGAIWFTGATSTGRNQIIRLTPTSGAVRTKYLPAGHHPDKIVRGPDNALWFTEYGDGTTGWIGRITAAGKLTEYPIPGARSAPGAITNGRHGTLWFADSTNNVIGRITP